VGLSIGLREKGTYCQHLYQVKFFPSLEDVLLISIPIFEEFLIHGRGSLFLIGSTDEKLHFIHLGAGGAINDMMGIRGYCHLPIVDGAMHGNAVNVNGEVTSKDTEEFPLRGMEMGGGFLPCGNELGVDATAGSHDAVEEELEERELAADGDVEADTEEDGEAFVAVADTAKAVKALRIKVSLVMTAYVGCIIFHNSSSNHCKMVGRGQL